MVTDIEREHRDETDRNPVISLLLAIRSSFILFVAALGTICFLLAMLFSTYIPLLNYNVLAAMFVIWGVSAFVYAALGYVGLRLIGYH
jgi:hypothetical protein